MFDQAMNQANTAGQPNPDDEPEKEEKTLYNDPKDRRRALVKKGGADKELTTLTVGNAR